MNIQNGRTLLGARSTLFQGASVKSPPQLKTQPTEDSFQRAKSDQNEVMLMQYMEGVAPIWDLPGDMRALDSDNKADDSPFLLDSSADSPMALDFPPNVLSSATKQVPFEEQLSDWNAAIDWSRINGKVQAERPRVPPVFYPENASQSFKDQSGAAIVNSKQCKPLEHPQTDFPHNASPSMDVDRDWDELFGVKTNPPSEQNEMEWIKQTSVENVGQEAPEGGKPYDRRLQNAEQFWSSISGVKKDKEAPPQGTLNNQQAAFTPQTMVQNTLSPEKRVEARRGHSGVIKYDMNRQTVAQSGKATLDKSYGSKLKQAALNLCAKGHTFAEIVHFFQEQKNRGDNTLIGEDGRVPTRSTIFHWWKEHQIQKT